MFFFHVKGKLDHFRPQNRFGKHKYEDVVRNLFFRLRKKGNSNRE